MTWLTPLLGLLIFSPSTAQDGCEGGDGSPTPVPTPDPATGDMDRFYQLLDDLEAASSTVEMEQLTEDFVYTVQYSDGFPIVDGDQVTFVYLQEEGVNEPLRVAGDFNGWDTSANSLLRAVQGFWLFYATIDLPAPSGRSMYKFVGRDTGGQDLWFADPVARRFQYDENGQYTLVSGPAQGEGSHLERYPLFYSNILHNERDLILYLPTGYDHEGDTYPALYLHDGQNVFDPNASYGGWRVDETMDALVSSNQMAEVVAIGMANTYDRMDEYTHEEDFLVGYGGYVGGDAALYSQFVVEEVMPFIEDHYRVRTGRENTAVLGSSLGGLVSYYMGWIHSDVFKYVGGMSSTLGWGSIGLNNPTMIENLEDALPLPNIYYLDSGGGDGAAGCPDSDGDGINDDSATASDNYCETLQLYDVLTSKGYGEDELLYVFAPGAEHNEASWAARVHYPLTFWFPSPNRSE